MRSCFEWCVSLCALALRILGPAGVHEGRPGGQNAVAGWTWLSRPLRDTQLHHLV